MTRDLIFGAFAKPLCGQLDVAPHRVEVHQRNADAIARLAITGVLTAAEAHRCRSRLVKLIARDLSRAAPSPGSGEGEP